MHWFIDFDDTLAVGPMTWAFANVIPAMVREHHLPYDAAVFDQAALNAQKRGNENVDEMTLVQELFATVGWPDTMKEKFLYDVYNGYRLTLFDDAKTFLDRLKVADQTLFIVSNNDKTAARVEQLGITAYFADVFTPKTCGEVRPKPDRDMWDYAVARYPLKNGAVMVGDDPWSDGAFSERCEVGCWMLDRLGRYSGLYSGKPYRWVKSLADISI